jgi:hypothetical protein
MVFLIIVGARIFTQLVVASGLSIGWARAITESGASKAGIDPLEFRLKNLKDKNYFVTSEWPLKLEEVSSK